MNKEHGIIISVGLIPATLEDRKTQTRRLSRLNVINKEPIGWNLEWFNPRTGYASFCRGDIVDGVIEITDQSILCPYGQVGDRLYVKETHYRYGRWIKNGFTKTGKQKWTFKGAPELITLSTIRGKESLRYINNPPDNVKPNSYRKEAWYKRASIFMPRWASRITLEITGVRVERLQEITDEDAVAEGVRLAYWQRPQVDFLNAYLGKEAVRVDDYSKPLLSAKEEFHNLWDSLNAKRGYSWETNPWVWVIEFKRLIDGEHEHLK